MREQVQVATTRADVEGVIPDKMYFRIGEVAAIVGVKPYVLRYWESEFAALRPQKSRTRQRMYRRRDVELLLKIKHLLYERKYTIAGARQLLRRGLPGAVEQVPEAMAEAQGTPVPVALDAPASSPAAWLPVDSAGLDAPPAAASPATVPASSAVAPTVVAPVAPVTAVLPEQAPRSQLSLDLRSSGLTREDLCRALRDLLTLCDADEVADPDPLTRSARQADELDAATRGAGDPG